LRDQLPHNKLLIRDLAPHLSCYQFAVGRLLIDSLKKPAALRFSRTRHHLDALWASSPVVTKKVGSEGPPTTPRRSKKQDRKTNSAWLVRPYHPFLLVQPRLTHNSPVEQER
jgi:hypothetical protein